MTQQCADDRRFCYDCGVNAPLRVYLGRAEAAGHWLLRATSTHVDSNLHLIQLQWIPHGVRRPAVRAGRTEVPSGRSSSVRKGNGWSHLGLCARPIPGAGAAPDDLTGPWAVPWAAAPVLGAMVFQLLSRPQPEWGWGVSFAGWLGVVLGLWAGFQPPFEHSGAGQAALLGVYIFALAGLAGMGGASLASLVVRVLGPRQAWRAGLAVLLTEVLVVVVLAAVLR